MDIEVNNLSFEYIKNNETLKNVSFKFSSGDIIAVLGVNGAGKSTLIKCLGSIYKPKSGQILIGEKNLTSLNSNEKARLISYVPQSISFPDFSVFDSILIGRKPYINVEPKEEDYKIISNAITSLGLDHLAFKNVNQISGGEKQKVAIARALVQSSSVILFDEPTSSLDVKNQLEAINLIKRIVKENNLIAFVVIHDINLALKLANKFLLLKEGQVFDKGDLSIITESNLDSLYGVSTKIYENNNQKFVIFDN